MNFHFDKSTGSKMRFKVCDKMPPMRLFIGLFPPPEIAAHLSSQLRKIPEPFQLSWTPEISRHVTLKFLGTIPDQNVPKIQAVLMALAARFKSFTLFCKGGGCFPAKGNPRVFWTGLEGDTDSLKKLATDVEEGCRDLGYPAENKPFSPHLTLARVERKKAQVQQAIKSFENYQSPPFKVEALCLVESQTLPMGARYKILSRHPFKEIS